MPLDSAWSITLVEILLRGWQVIVGISAIDLHMAISEIGRNFGVLGHISPGRRQRRASQGSPLDPACSITLV